MTMFQRTFGVRRGEGRSLALVAGAFAAVEMGRGLGEVGADTLVTNRLGPDVFPILYIGLGLVSLVVSLAYGAALSRSGSARFFPALLLALAAVLVAEWLIAFAGSRDTVLAFVWVSIYAASMLLMTATWTVGGFTFDARQAKRLFPLLTSAAIVGSLAGFLAAIVVQGLTGDATWLILAEALLLSVAAALLSGLGQRIRPRRDAGERRLSLRASVTAGADYVAHSPLMRLVAVGYVLLAVLMFGLTYPFMKVMNASFPTESQLLPVLALFSAAVTVASFLAGTLLANRLYARFGVATVAIALPAMYVLGFGLWIVRFTFITAILVRFSQQVTQRGFSNAAFGAFYSVLPGRRRGQVLAFMDGVPGQIGTVVVGVLLLVVSTTALGQADTVAEIAESAWPIFGLGVLAGLACLVVFVLARRAYGRSLVTTLREGRGEQVLEGGPGIMVLGRDASTIDGLRAATTSIQPAERILAADLLGRLGARQAVGDLRRLCTDGDAGVRATALLALGRLEGRSEQEVMVAGTGDEEPTVRVAALEALLAMGAPRDSLVDATLTRLRDDPEPEVRAALATFMGQAGDPSTAQSIVADLIAARDLPTRRLGLDALAGMERGVDASAALDALTDEDAQVRAAAIRAAEAHGLIGADRLMRALDDDASSVRRAAASALAAHTEAMTEVATVLETAPGRVQEAALWALDGHAELVRPQLVHWLQAQLSRALDLRGHQAILAPAGSGTTAAYLAHVIGRRVAAIEGRLLQALAILGAPEATGLIRRSLRAPDPEVRAQALEALDVLADARLVRGVVRLLEYTDDDDASSEAGVIACASELGSDDDRWVRALALRTLSEHLHDSQRELVSRVRRDPDPIVALAVPMEEGGTPVPDRPRLVNEVDRMLMLRRVPLFEALDPEDLHRVAMQAQERAWAEGDALMVEGDVGDELIVIVEGDVRVVHQEGAEERLIRTYGPGDHIGELAVLREAPRAATVIASTSGVRGLVISGEAIGALLQERPEAAAAMLATLAERLSQHS
jgi:HEAT repeat protein